jgi:hypothetical protein
MCIESLMSDTLATIQARRAEIARAISLLQTEDQELATAEAVLQRFSRAAKPGSTVGLPPNPRSRPRNQREFVLDVLASSEPVWLRSSDIVRLAKLRWGVDLPEPSLRPLLSVMKQQRLIVRKGRLVALSERAPETTRTGRPEV